MFRPGCSAASTVFRGLQTTFLGCVLAVFMVTAVSAQSAGSFELRNGVVVDSTAGKAYFMSPEGGIEALDLKSGNILWRSTAAARPISVSAAGLLAQVESSAPGRLELAVLDVSGRALKTASLTLPQGVEAPVVDGLSHRFRVRASSVGGQIQVDWQSMIIAPRGALIRDGSEVPQLTSGGFALDPASGAVSGVATRPGGLAFPSVQVGDQYLSADGNYRLATTPSAGSIPDLYEWSLFDAAGSQVGRIDVRGPYAPFHVMGGVVVVVTPPGGYLQGEEWIEERLALRGLSLATGLELWSHEIRDSAYQGPYPP